MDITLRIRRTDPQREPPAWWSEYHLEAEPFERVLDLLVRVKETQDGTLSFRRSCAHGICGSDAMRINGSNRLACKTLVKDTGVSITVEPLLGLAVEKDLIVNMDPFFAAYRSIHPYLINEEPLPADGRERLQSHAQRMRIDDTAKCILCASCTTSCPVFWSNGKYVGPMAAVQAHRFLFDSRDHGAAEHAAALTGSDGIWRCRTIFNCTLSCPREIKVTKAIAEVKQVLMRGVEPAPKEAQGGK
jgi:succinate dehydrogenase / fumarate reductase, iron-sulfur subunit